MATTTEAWWAKQVAEWRASGLTSEEFSRGRGFTGGLLRNWACRLGKQRASREAVIRIAKVEREVARAQVEEASSREDTSAAVLLEVGSVRVAVRRGTDRETLAMVLDLLRGGGVR